MPSAESRLNTQLVLTTYFADKKNKYRHIHSSRSEFIPNSSFFHPSLGDDIHLRRQSHEPIPFTNENNKSKNE